MNELRPPTEDHQSLPWVQPGNWSERYGGLTKRELFAAMAMQGIATTSSNGWVGQTRHDYEEVARRAVLCADALLKELAK